MSNQAQDYYPEENEPYFLHEDTRLGKCQECGSFLENWGAVSQGDGDLYDELGCPNCQEPRGKANEIWFPDVYEDGELDPDEIVYPDDAFENREDDPCLHPNHFRVGEFE